MTEKKKPARRLKATCYAVRRKSDGKWWNDMMEWGRFPRAALFWGRPSPNYWRHDVEVIPCRVTPLLSARKNRTRTR